MTMKALPCSNCIHNVICMRKDEIEMVGQKMVEDYKDMISNHFTITISCDEYRSTSSYITRDVDIS